MERALEGRACGGTIRLRVSRAAAERLKLRSTTLATPRVARSGTVRLRLTLEAHTALARNRGRTLKATLGADLRAGGHPVRSSRSLTLRR